MSMNVTKEELAAAFSEAAIFCNKIYLTLSSNTARLTFMEMYQGECTPIFRTAVAMSHADLIELQNMINQMLDVELGK